MKKKILKFASYLEQYPTITFFELKGIFGSALLYILIFLSALPLVLFSNQWLALFFGSFIILSSIWLFFDDALWMPDWIKRISISREFARKVASYLQDSVADTPSPSWQHFYLLNILTIGIAAFFIGFIQSSGACSFFMAVTILIASSASFLESARTSLLSCVVFVFACWLAI